MITISIINQKGGVAKTSTASALACSLAHRHKKTLLIDLDSQTSLTLVSGISSGSRTVADILTDNAPISEAIASSNCGDIIPGDERLSVIDISQMPTDRLKSLLKSINRLYDYCIIDCPPSLNLITIQSLSASDYCIIPIQADILSINALRQIYSTVQIVQQKTNNRLRVGGILVTRYNGRAIISREALAQVETEAEAMHTKVFNSKIRECIAIKEAQALQENLLKYAPRSNASADYLSLADEILKKGI